MATLDQVTQKLSEGNAENKLGHEETRNQLLGISGKFDQFFGMLAGEKMDELEAKRESRQRPAPAAAGGSAGSGFDFGAGFGLSSLAIPAVAALAASLTGLDEAFKALRVVAIAQGIVEGVRAFNKRMVNFLDNLRDIGKTIRGIGVSLQKIIIIPDDTKALFTDFSARIKTNIVNYFDELVKPIKIAIDNFKVGFTRIGTTATGIVDDVLKMDDFQSLSAKAGALLGKITAPFRSLTTFFESTTDTIGGITKFLPSINFGALTELFGSFEEGTGFLGLFGKIFRFLDPLLKPIKMILGLALRPMFQLFLSVFDFLYGFYTGFKEASGGLMERLGAGIEGGIKGVIKGFTEAIDLILFKLPAWLLEKLGFEGIAEKLSDFSLTALVDPAWEAMKEFFRNAFNNPSDTMVNVASSISDMGERFMKMILQGILPDPTKDYSFYDPRKYVTAAIPDSIYEYAGIDPKTGGLIKPDTSDRSGQLGQAQQTQNQIYEDDIMRRAQGQANMNVRGGDTNVNNSSAAVVPPGAAIDMNDMQWNEGA